jgi:mannose-6-phosphate isomerase-like protein (cupin superfamily)
MAGAVVLAAQLAVAQLHTSPARDEQRAPFVGDLMSAARENRDFRRVYHTGVQSQLVLMSLPPGVDIGAEKHGHIEQTLVVVGGQGQARLAGQIRAIGPGSVVVVPPGVLHDLVNTGRVPMQLYTVYTPAAHLPGRVHRTKREAAADLDDREVSETPR